MKKTIIKTAWAVSSFFVLGGTAMAAGSDVNHMAVTGKTSQPIGHYEYCKTYGKDCAIRATSTKPIKLTRKRWSEMVKANAYANHSVKPVTDLEYYKRDEFWTYPKKYGDCEDYVLLKRKMLMDQGWPATNLLITVVTLPNGDGHAVLTVRTDRADYALDNLDDKIKPWNKTEYRFLKRQSARHSGRWETIVDPRNAVVGAVKN